MNSAEAIQCENFLKTMSARKFLLGSVSEDNKAKENYYNASFRETTSLSFFSTNDVKSIISYKSIYSRSRKCVSSPDNTTKTPVGKRNLQCISCHGHILTFLCTDTFMDTHTRIHDS